MQLFTAHWLFLPLCLLFYPTIWAGNILSYKKGKKVGVYNINIAGDINKDRDYHVNYLKNKAKEIFDIEANEVIPKRRHERFLTIYSKELVEFFSQMGLIPGHKIKNQITIPDWILKNESYLKACLRGLIDTDGSIFRMSKRDYNLIRINFTNYNKKLLVDTRNAFIQLGFHPSNIINEHQIYLSRQNEISKYLKDIGFSNKKHIDRLNSIRSSVV